MKRIALLMSAFLLTACATTSPPPAAPKTAADTCKLGFSILGMPGASSYEKQAVLESMRGQGCFSGNMQPPQQHY